MQIRLQLRFSAWNEQRCHSPANGRFELYFIFNSKELMDANVTGAGLHPNGRAASVQLARDVMMIQRALD